MVKYNHLGSTIDHTQKKKKKEGNDEFSVSFLCTEIEKDSKPTESQPFKTKQNQCHSFLYFCL